MKALDFENSPHRVAINQILALEQKNLSTLGMIQVLTICPFGVDKSYRLALQLNELQIPAKFLEDGLKGMTDLRIRDKKYRFTQLISRLSLIPAIYLIISELGKDNNAYKDTVKALDNIVIHNSVESAVLELREIHHK